MKSEGWRQGQRDDLTLPELANMLWGRRALVAGCVLILALAAIVFALSHGTTYVAGAAVSVRPAEGFDEEEPQVLVQRVRDSVETPELSRVAMERAGWEAGVAEFNERLVVETDTSSAGIRVQFYGRTSEEAVRAANAYARSFASEVDELGQQRLAGGTLAARARVTREATPDTARSRGPLFYGALACAAGLLLGAAAAFVLENRTHRWRGARDAELTLRAPVLGTIPSYGPAEEEP